MVHAALERDWTTHRFNMRGCGGADELAQTSYHAGQTSDLLAFLQERRRATSLPVFVIGFSLGGNVTLKLAGELAEGGRDLISGVCAVSTPIDLAACAAALAEPRNFLYQGRFLSRLKDRIRRKNRQAPDVYTLEHLPKIRTIEDFDDHYTARLFGFGTAANYFRTQSSNQFLERIRVPALLVQAKDDPLVPFPVFEHPAFASNPCLTLLAVEHGGHLGFLSRGKARFWLDETVLEWAENIVGNIKGPNRVF
jgi:predicted alpha/beta-fold hydrolase